MKRTELFQLVERALSTEALEEAICEALEDYIDYDEIAAQLMEDLADEIRDAALSVAREKMDYLPF